MVESDEARMLFMNEDVMNKAFEKELDSNASDILFGDAIQPCCWTNLSVEISIYEVSTM